MGRKSKGTPYERKQRRRRGHSVSREGENRGKGRGSSNGEVSFVGSCGYRFNQRFLEGGSRRAKQFRIEAHTARQGIT